MSSGYVVPVMHDGQVTATVGLVTQLLARQFPEWAELSVTAIPGGTDHAMFAIGDRLLARFPLTEDRGSAIVDAKWLPLLAPYLPVQVPAPLGLGHPDEDYPWSWTIAPWIEGAAFDHTTVDLRQAAIDMARFVRALHSAPPLGGPSKQPGSRGTPVRNLDVRVRSLIAQLADEIDVVAVTATWDAAMAAPPWHAEPTWLHTDLAPGNVIVRDGRIVGVIDFGLGLGDPAPDLLPAWQMFTGESSALFLDEVGYDQATVARAKAWVLAPALGGLIYYRDTRPDFVARSHENLQAVLNQNH